MNLGGDLSFNFSLAAGKMVEQGIMVDILLRLPVKSLTRFKCVCKSWRDLISDPRFARAHYRCMFLNPNAQRLFLAMELPNSMPKFLCYENTSSEAIADEIDLLEYPVKFKLPKPSRLAMIVGSCNGLVCLQVWGDTYASRTLVVWNPTTGVFKDIPLHPDVTDNEGFHLFGFGYDSATDDYKILAYADSATKGYEVVIFAMKKNYWRSICMRHVKFCPIRTGVYANGFLYWLQLSHNDSLRRSSCSILSFDLSNEKFEMMPPPVHINYTCVIELVEYQGCLLFYTGEDYYKCKKSWIMEGLGSWTKVCDITCQSGDTEMAGRAMCDGKVLLRFLLGENYTPKVLFHLYSPKKNKCTPFCNPMLRDAQLYVESLVSP